jgi:hypothetical protein
MTDHIFLCAARAVLIRAVTTSKEAAMDQLQNDVIESLLDLNAALNEMLLEMHHLLLLLCDERSKLEGPALAAIRILANDVIARARRRA